MNIQGVPRADHKFCQHVQNVIPSKKCVDSSSFSRYGKRIDTKHKQRSDVSELLIFLINYLFEIARLHASLHKII